MTKPSNAACVVPFRIDEHSCIALHLPYPSAEVLQPHEEIPGMYHDSYGNIYPVFDRQGGIENELEGFIDHLEHLLKGECEIDRQNFPNLGLQWNERLHDPNQHGTWPGCKYLCFSTEDNVETFMYTEKGTIVLEVVPMYPWLLGQKPEKMEYVSFETFLESYAPLVKTVVARENVEEWLDTAKWLYEIVEQNGRKPRTRTAAAPDLATLSEPCPCNCHEHEEK